MAPSLLRTVAFASLSLSATLPRASAQCEVDRIDALVAEGWGYDLAYDGDRLLVPVRATSTALGEVYVYERGGAGWSLMQVLRGSSAHFSDGFGGTARIDGDTIVVPAVLDSSSAQYAGAVYVFEHIGGNWVETAKLSAPNPVLDGRFGCSVDVSGERIVVGSPCVLGSPIPEGLVHVFHKTGGGWLHEQELQPSVIGTVDLFGETVAISGDTLLVGAPLHNYFLYRSGAVFVFERSGGSWTEVQVLTGSGSSQFGQLGRSVDLAGDLAVAGAPHENGGTGAAYVYQRQAGAFVQTQHVLPVAGMSFANYGRRVRTDGASLSMLGSAPFPVHLYRMRQGQFDLTARYLLEFPNPYAWEADFVGDTAMLTRADQFSFGNGFIQELHIAEEVRPYCYCEDREWCRARAAGCDNSTGVGARILSCGTTSVASDDLVLTTDRLPPNQFALIFMGAGATERTFGDGFRCVSAGGAGVFRFPIRSGGASGLISEGPGLVAHSIASFPPAGHIAAGDTWNFQAWFRDPVGPSCPELGEVPVPTGFGLSNAVEVRFVP